LHAHLPEKVKLARAALAAEERRVVNYIAFIGEGKGTRALAEALQQAEHKVDALRGELQVLTATADAAFQVPPLEWVAERLSGWKKLVERETARPALLLRRVLGPLRLVPFKPQVGRTYYRAETAIQVLELLDDPDGGSNSLRQWRRGGSNPGRRGAAGNHGPRKPPTTSPDDTGGTRQVLPFGHRVPKTSVLGHQRGAKRVPSERASTRARCRTFPRGTRPRRDRGSTPKDPQESNLTRKAERFPPTNLPSPTYEDGDLNPMAGPTRPGCLRGLRPHVYRDDRLTGP